MQQREPEEVNPNQRNTREGEPLEEQGQQASQQLFQDIAHQLEGTPTTPKLKTTEHQDHGSKPRRQIRVNSMVVLEKNFSLFAEKILEDVDLHVQQFAHN